MNHGCSQLTANTYCRGVPAAAASTLLGFDPTAATFDINNLDLPNAAGMRPGAPESSIMPLCYKVL